MGGESKAFDDGHHRDSGPALKERRPKAFSAGERSRGCGREKDDPH
jgi:hypothetical protein